MLVEITGWHGKPVWVNPDHVLFITERTEGKVTVTNIVMLHPSYVYSSQSVSEVAAKLNGAEVAK